MYKKIRRLLIILAILGIALMILGITFTNDFSWKKYAVNYKFEKQEQIEYYIERNIEDLSVILESSAEWTAARDRILMKDSDWLYENATGYLADTTSFNIDQVYTSNEEGDFKRNYMREIFIDIEDLNSYKKAIYDDEKSVELAWDGIYPVLVAASPFYDNSVENPTGCMVITRVIKEEEIKDLKRVLVSSEIEEIFISKNPLYKELVTDGFGEIKVSIPFGLGGKYLYVNIDAKIDYLTDMFKVQGRVLIYILSVVAIAFIAILFKNTKVLVRKIIVVIEAVEKISAGNYHIKIEEDKSKMLPEVNILIASVNKMSSEVEGHIQTIEEYSKDMSQKYVEMIELLVRTVELNDSYTYQHSFSVSDHALMIGRAIGFEDLENLELAAKLHDVGKIAISTGILNKPGKLTEDEYKIIKTHSQEGYNLVDGIDVFAKAKEAILYHHERYDGKGYPVGLKGNEIPLMAQIISIADVYDALTSNRSYRKAMECEKAINIIKKDSGTAFNPELVEVFIKELQKQCKEKHNKEEV